MIVGDNIYHRAHGNGEWQQEDSHHSNPDGSVNPHNLLHDTRIDRVLISDCFIYFGAEAPDVPVEILDGMGYRNPRDYRVFERPRFDRLVEWLSHTYGASMNCVLGDPFDFDESTKRYSAGDDRLR